MNLRNLIALALATGATLETEVQVIDAGFDEPADIQSMVLEEKAVSEEVEAEEGSEEVEVERVLILKLV